MSESAISCEGFGKLEDGTPVERWTLEAGGTRVRVLTYGGIVQTVEVPDRAGDVADVALGLASVEDYVAHGEPYFGALIGRYANRIKGAAFTLDGRAHRVTANEGRNCLHGGARGFDKRVWDAEGTRTGDGGAALTLRRTSPDGEEGFPGTLDTAVTYTVTARGDLRLDFRATTDAPTVVSLTSHLYANLDGEGSGTAEHHELRVAASRYTVNGADSVATGEIADVAGTPLDFRAAKPVGRDLRSGHGQLLIGGGYDQNLVLDKGVTEEPEFAAELYSPASGRVLTLSTTQPAVQLYSANFVSPSYRAFSGRTYRPGDGVALEAQHYPDSPNQPHFPSTVLRPGEEYAATTVYGFSVRAD